MKIFRYVAIVVCTGGAWLVYMLSSLALTAIMGAGMDDTKGRPKARWLIVSILPDYFSSPGYLLVAGAFICSLLFSFQTYKALSWTMMIVLVIVASCATGMTMADVFITACLYGYRVGTLWIAALVLIALNSFIPATATISMFAAAYDIKLPLWAVLSIICYYLGMTLILLFYYLNAYRKSKEDIAIAKAEWIE